MSDNTTILTAGARVYSQKRKKRKEQLPEILFDEDSRRDYLTGFHKRKLERRARAQEIAKIKAHEAKLEARKERRQATKDLAEERLRQFNASIGVGAEEESDGEEEEEEETENVKADSQAEYRTPSTLTTVTVITEMNSDTEEPTPAPTVEVSKPKVPDTTAKITKPVKPRPKKFRYECKRVRKVEQAKTKKHKLAAASKRRKN
ncbi:rRNA binding [Basidiobolus ranarum]|uniref:rRNA binding n=1 Tax=Basidiobolus ranarum TaxID=34480 RepID=A0ABR2X0J0_9FUNG